MPKASEHARKILIAIDEIKTYQEQIGKAIDNATKESFKNKIQQLYRDIDQESTGLYNAVGAEQGLQAPETKKAKIPLQARSNRPAPAPAPSKKGSLQERLRALLPKRKEPTKESVTAPTPQAKTSQPEPAPQTSTIPKIPTATPTRTPAPAPKPSPTLTAAPKPTASPVRIPTPAAVPKADIPVPTGPPPKPMEKEPIIAPELASKKFKNLSKRQKEFYIKQIGIKYEELEDFVKSQQKKKKVKVKEIKTEDYTLYSPSDLGSLANRYMKKTADGLIAKHPKWFEPLFKNFLKVDMNILSRSYVSTLLFFSLIAFPLLLGFLLLVNLAFKFNIFLVIFIAIILGILTPVAFYIYPASLIGDRQKKIRRDLPFALVHMSAVAGSGAAPISIFELLVESEEYPELKKEIRKVLNYVNLFGYNLSNALRNVAGTTASEELKELLNGMISTIETGGDLKAYLKEKSEDSLNKYRLDRKKQVEALGTYSELYTSILIAAPLLMVVTLAIVNSITGQIGGFSIKTLANLAIFIILPLLNMGFMFFLKVQTAQ